MFCYVDDDWIRLEDRNKGRKKFLSRFQVKKIPTRNELFKK